MIMSQVMNMKPLDWVWLCTEDFFGTDEHRERNGPCSSVFVSAPSV